MAACLFCGVRPAGEGRNAHQLCRHCTYNPKARRAFPPKRGGHVAGSGWKPNQVRDRFGRFVEAKRVDYPDEVN
jgi:hypothetical protein